MGRVELGRLDTSGCQATIRDRTALPGPMARYFFHFHDGMDQPDHTGTELASAQAARDVAVVFMGEKTWTGASGRTPNGPSASWMRPARRSVPSGSVATSEHDRVHKRLVKCSRPVMERRRAGG